MAGSAGSPGTVGPSGAKGYRGEKGDIGEQVSTHWTQFHIFVGLYFKKCMTNIFILYIIYSGKNSYLRMYFHHDITYKQKIVFIKELFVQLLGSYIG